MLTKYVVSVSLYNEIPATEQQATESFAVLSMEP